MRWIAVALAALVATPVAAMTERQCAQGFEAFAGYLTTPFVFTRKSLAIDGQCDVRGILAEPDAPILIEIDSLQWAAGDIDRFIEQALPPTSLRLEIEGLRVFAKTGDIPLDYALRLQAQPNAMSVSLDVSWDRETRQIFLKRAAWSDGEGNAVTVNAVASGVDLMSWNTLAQSIGSAGISGAELKLESHSVVERYLAAAFAPLLLTDERPANAQVADLKAQAQTALGTVPDSFMSPESQSALQDLVADLPLARGRLDLTLAADPPIGMTQFLRLSLGGLPRTLEDLWPKLEGIAVSADWTPLAAD